MADERPRVVVLAGPNGAGKSTSAPLLLPATLGIQEFVNADVIAHGLSAFRPETAAMHAGRIMLDRLHELAARRVSFAFETTLASRTFAPWIGQLQAEGEYIFHLIFLWLPTAEAAVNRVLERVRQGGHHVPEETIRRRCEAGLRNFFRLYRPLANLWHFYDNSDDGGPRLLASGCRQQEIVSNAVTWKRVAEWVQHEPETPG